MRFFWTASVWIALSTPAIADDCKIQWFDLFLPQSEVAFERTSDVSASLTLKNTSQRTPITFSLAQEELTGEHGNKIHMLVGEQTLVDGGLSNHVTVSLQPKTKSWLVVFESKQTMVAKDGQTFLSKVLNGGYLICEQLQP